MVRGAASVVRIRACAAAPPGASCATSTTFAPHHTPELLPGQIQGFARPRDDRTVAGPSGSYVGYVQEDVPMIRQAAAVVVAADAAGPRDDRAIGSQDRSCDGHHRRPGLRFDRVRGCGRHRGGLLRVAGRAGPAGGCGPRTDPAQPAAGRRARSPTSRASWRPPASWRRGASREPGPTPGSSSRTATLARWTTRPDSPATGPRSSGHPWTRRPTSPRRPPRRPPS